MQRGRLEPPQGAVLRGNLLGKLYNGDRAQLTHHTGGKTHATVVN